MDHRSEKVTLHREILEKYPSNEPCSCDPAYGRWCAFHAEFDTDMSERSRELLDSLAQRALRLHEAIRGYLAYPNTANHKEISRGVGGTETLIELYLKEREHDHEAEKQRLRRERG